ncbi:hypothetical protein CEXT_70511 [Caerostris extrusa]|uniref:Uncharacterized protein n=1 Tax=Caerostris extrusa TaxID=172846 RepID=A0AAV4R685_CAEEX|nr:hypothetical protein CEXT_70511 [Caerostris extrusa]
MHSSVLPDAAGPFCRSREQIAEDGTWKWCDAFGTACRSKYKSEMQRCSQEVKGFMQETSPSAPRKRSKNSSPFLRRYERRKVDIDSSITPVE